VTNKKCFAISNYNQLKTLIKIRKKSKKLSVIFIKNYLIKGLGVDWLKTLIHLILNNNKNHNIKFFVDSGYDYSLSILLIRENIDYIKLKSNDILLKKINQIAKKNKVLLNPNFNIVDLTKIKNIENIKRKLI